MRGIIFTEFIEMVEQSFSLDVAEHMIQQSQLPSGGAYTSVGNYSHEELLALIGRLHQLTGIPVVDLVMAFGEYLFRRFSEIYPTLFEGISDPVTFIENVHGHIHIAVKKLYPETKLPSVIATRTGPNSLEVRYESVRPLAIVAEALIRGCFKYFSVNYQLERIDNPDSTGCSSIFRIQVVD